MIKMSSCPQRGHQKTNKNISAKRKFFLNVKVFNVFIVIAICCGGVLYLANINNTATKGFKTKELEERQAFLEESIKKAEFQTADLQSVQKIKERVNALNMVAVTRTEYAGTASTVAVK
ncbi:MAG TPA: hypothetical protein VJB41_03205 [Patescibacteria group bacterium]|nr:hypothetical protein [Patescibacteria group bacterium]